MESKIFLGLLILGWVSSGAWAATPAIEGALRLRAMFRNISLDDLTTDGDMVPELNRRLLAVLVRVSACERAMIMSVEEEIVLTDPGNGSDLFRLTPNVTVNLNMTFLKGSQRDFFIDFVKRSDNGAEFFGPSYGWDPMLGTLRLPVPVIELGESFDFVPDASTDTQEQEAERKFIIALSVSVAGFLFIFVTVLVCLFRHKMAKLKLEKPPAATPPEASMEEGNGDRASVYATGVAGVAGGSKPTKWPSSRTLSPDGAGHRSPKSPTAGPATPHGILPQNGGGGGGGVGGAGGPGSAASSGAHGGGGGGARQWSRSLNGNGGAAASGRNSGAQSTAQSIGHVSDGVAVSHAASRWPHPGDSSSTNPPPISEGGGPAVDGPSGVWVGLYGFRGGPPQEFDGTTITQTEPVTETEEGDVGPSPAWRALWVDPISVIVGCTVPANIIGQGFSSRVYRAHWRGTPVAIKEFDLRVDPRVTSSFQRELEVLSTLRHPHIIRLLAYTIHEDTSKGYLVLEYAANHSLDDWLYPNVYVLHGGAVADPEDIDGPDPSDTDPSTRALKDAWLDVCRIMGDEKKTTGSMCGYLSVRLRGVLGITEAQAVYSQACCPSLPCLVVRVGPQYYTAPLPSAASHNIRGEELVGLTRAMLASARRLTFVESIRVAYESWQALHWLHSNREGGRKEAIVHTDVKPGNILLDDGLRVRLADVGLALSLPLDPDKSHVTTVMLHGGTEGYLDPQAKDPLRPLKGEKNDVYAFGVVLYELFYPYATTAAALAAQFGPGAEGEVRDLLTQLSTLARRATGDWLRRPSSGELLAILEDLNRRANMVLQMASVAAAAAAAMAAASASASGAAAAQAQAQAAQAQAQAQAQAAATQAAQAQQAQQQKDKKEEGQQGQHVPTMSPTGTQSAY